MEPVRVDALLEHEFHKPFGPGDDVYCAWGDRERSTYDKIPTFDLMRCYKQWVEYYLENPRQAVADREALHDPVPPERTP